jgi:hypothetical protein
MTFLPVSKTSLDWCAGKRRARHTPPPGVRYPGSNWDLATAGSLPSNRSENMGHYTELFFAAEVDLEAAHAIQEFLGLTAEQFETDYLPPHRFFTLPGAGRLLVGWSAYSSGSKVSAQLEREVYPPAGQESYHLTIRSSFKNYENELDHFLDWITPHVVYVAQGFDEDSGFKYVGHSLYENAKVPTLHFINVKEHRRVAYTPPALDGGI